MHTEDKGWWPSQSLWPPALLPPQLGLGVGHQAAGVRLQLPQAGIYFIETILLTVFGIIDTEFNLSYSDYHILL